MKNEELSAAVRFQDGAHTESTERGWRRHNAGGSKRIGFSIAAAIGCGLGFVVVTSSPSGDPARVPHETHTSRVPVRGELSASAVASENDRAAEFERVAAAGSNAATPLDAKIRGRFVGADGAAVSGVRVKLVSLGQLADGRESDERVCAEVVSAPDGAFAFAIEPGMGTLLRLDALPGDLCARSWRWPRIDAERGRDLGDVRLERPGTVTGHLFDEHGELLRGRSWTVRAEHAWPSDLAGACRVEVRTESDPLTGSFELRGVQPGRSRLRADQDGTNVFFGEVVELEPGATVYSDLVCSIGHVRSRIGVRVACPPYGRVDERFLPGLTLRRPDGTRLTARTVTETSSFAFDGLSAGAYTLEVDDPRFEPWTRAGVEPGDVVAIELRGSSRARLSVRDAESGAPVHAYTITSTTAWPAWRPLTAHLSSIDDVAQEEALLTGLLPVPQTLTVRADGRAPCEIEVSPGAGETLRLTAVLTRGKTLRGVVRDEATHEPVGGARVYLARRDATRKIDMLEDVPDVSQATSDRESGAFAFEALAPGTYSVQAVAAPTLRSGRADVVLESTTGDETLELALPAAATVRGRVIGPAGARFEELQLLLVPETFAAARNGVVGSRTWRQRIAIQLAADGSYHAGPLPAGSVRASLLAPDVCLPIGFTGTSQTCGGWIDLGVSHLSAGTDNVVDFDATASFPGRLDVRLVRHGVADGESVLELCNVHDRYLTVVAGEVVSGADSIPLGPVPPGEYLLVLRALDRSWYAPAPANVRVSCNAAAHTTFVATVSETRVRVRAPGAPAPGAGDVLHVLARAGVPLPETRCPLDADGYARLKLAAGRYAIALRRAGDAASENEPLTIDWPLADGVRELVVRSQAPAAPVQNAALFQSLGR